MRTVVRAVRFARLKAKIGSRITVGSSFAVGKRAEILTPHFFRVGDRVRIGQDFVCETDVEIGNDVLISSRVSLIGNDHEFDVPGVSVFQGRRLPTARVVLEGDNLLGHGVIIVGSVTIGRGAIIGAGSLVTRDIPAGWVCHGRPAKPVRRRLP